ncbi:MAG: NF038122 family metalloprotease [Candidatus Udaeobacter sp.]
MKLLNVFLIVLGIVCMGLLPGIDAVVPAADGENSGDEMAESDNALLSLTDNSKTISPVAGFAASSSVQVHETRADSQEALQFPSGNEISMPIERFSPAVATRCSFMASWGNVVGATGYLLDVSTNDSFSDYLDGYHDLDVGNVTGRVVTGLTPGTAYYYRVRPYSAIASASYSETTRAVTVPTSGLMIHATFDSSITGNPNAAAIQAMISRAISIYESLFSDPVTIQIRFRYATTSPNGNPLPQGVLAQSLSGSYLAPWNTAIDGLRADATTTNDNVAIASLPGNALSANIIAASANVRALGGNAPPDVFANGTVGPGGPYDGIVTLNSAMPYQFTRPTGGGSFDAQRATEHEIDEVMGLGSHLNLPPPGTDLRPQDVFNWGSPGVRNLTSSGTRYFSINGGNTNLVSFNQQPNSDFGDWVSTACPQSQPHVQNAFACRGQSSDVTATSPEGINLDVIGYDLVNAVVTTNAATNITSSSAKLNGTVNPGGTMIVHFQYGMTTTYGSTTANSTRTGNATQGVSANIPGLTPNTTYHFRLVGTINGENRYGQDRTFRTFNPTGPPVAVTSAATSVASFSARLNGSVYPHTFTTTVHFQYGRTASYGFTTAPRTSNGNTYQNVFTNVSGLSAHTRYHFRIVASNAAGTRYGVDRIFVTD